jgi:hypothetical protein
MCPRICWYAIMSLTSSTMVVAQTSRVNVSPVMHLTKIMSATVRIQNCETLMMHREEPAALRDRGLWQLIRVVGDFLQREATETRRQVGVLLIVWDTNSALEGDFEILVDYKGPGFPSLQLMPVYACACFIVGLRGCSLSYAQ